MIRDLAPIWSSCSAPGPGLLPEMMRQQVGAVAEAAVGAVETVAVAPIVLISLFRTRLSAVVFGSGFGSWTGQRGCW